MCYTVLKAIKMFSAFNFCREARDVPRPLFAFEGKRNRYRVKLLDSSESHEIRVAPGITRFIFVGTVLTYRLPHLNVLETTVDWIGAAPGSSQFSSEASTVTKMKN